MCKSLLLTHSRELQGAGLVLYQQVWEACTAPLEDFGGNVFELAGPRDGKLEGRGVLGRRCLLTKIIIALKKWSIVLIVNEIKCLNNLSYKKEFLGQKF